jgi:hypothetical protein
MSQHNDHYLRLAHNVRFCCTDGENTDTAGIAGLLIGGIMVLVLAFMT